MSKLAQAIDEGKSWAIQFHIEKKMWRPERGGLRSAPTQSEHLVGVAGMGNGAPMVGDGTPLQIGVFFEKPDPEKVKQWKPELLLAGDHDETGGAQSSTPHARDQTNKSSSSLGDAERIAPEDLDDLKSKKRVDLRRDEDYGPMPGFEPPEQEEWQRRERQKQERQQKRLKSMSPGPIKEDLAMHRGEPVNEGGQRKHWMTR